MRLDKYLAEAAVGSKKIVRNYVLEGQVTVNHQVVVIPATEIDEKADVIRCFERDVIHTGKKYYMFYKPAGCITARKDEECKTVLDYFDTDLAEGIFPVGRLDKDTEGLLLLTNDGEFSNGLMNPKQHVPKTYYFWAFGSIDSEGKQQMLSGVRIGDKEALAMAVSFSIEEEGLYPDLLNQMDSYNIKDVRINPYQQPVLSGYITIMEGRKHQIKRMLKAVGCYVVYLKRISIGQLKLDESLEKGRYRELTQDEVRLLQKTHINDQVENI